MKVALYARVSKADDSQDPENQVMRLREYADSRGWEVYGEPYIDYASGADAFRPALDRMLSDARAHRFGIVLVVKIDRIARSCRNLLNILEDLKARGVAFECTDQNISTNTIEGELLLQLLAAIAQFERGLISQRTKAGLARAVAQGKRLGHPPIDIDLDRVRALRETGWSYRQIAQEFGVSHQTIKNRLRYGVPSPPIASDGNQGA